MPAKLPALEPNMITRQLLLERLQRLSRREREVVLGMLAAKSTKQIADDLGLSPRTVETYRARVFDRLGVRGATQLALYVTAEPQAGAKAVLGGREALTTIDALGAAGKRSLPQGGAGLAETIASLRFSDRPHDSAINVSLLWSRSGEASAHLIVPLSVETQVKEEGFPPVGVVGPLNLVLAYGFYLALQTGSTMRITGDRQVWRQVQGGQAGRRAGSIYADEFLDAVHH